MLFSLLSSSSSICRHPHPSIRWYRISFLFFHPFRLMSKKKEVLMLILEALLFFLSLLFLFFCLPFTLFFALSSSLFSCFHPISFSFVVFVYTSNLLFLHSSSSFPSLFLLLIRRQSCRYCCHLLSLISQIEVRWPQFDDRQVFQIQRVSNSRRTNSENRLGYNPEERVIIIVQKILLIVIVRVAGSNEEEEKKRNMRVGESSDQKNMTVETRGKKGEERKKKK